jgi:thioredoxin-dependent peroxiredoxin
MATLKEGGPAPSFALTDQHGKTVSLADYRGRKLLIFFYPRADTPGCTKQACSVRDSGAQFARKGVAAIGISPDQPGDQASFDEKFTLGFPLLSDPDHRIAEAFGVWGEKTSYGKTVMGIIRSSFLVDESGTIEKAWYKVTPEDTVPNALAAVS